MWVSILQNGRKKHKQTTDDKISQYLKLTDKSSYSTQLSRSTVSSSRIQQKSYLRKQKENMNCGSPSTGATGSVVGMSGGSTRKLKGVASTASLLNKGLTGSCVGAFNDSDNSRKNFVKITQQQIFTLPKSSKYKDKDNFTSYLQRQRQRQKQKQKQRESNKSQLQKSSSQSNPYFFRLFQKKNRLRSQLNINIHNSIYTFKQFMKACQSANAKAVDIRVPKLNENQNRKTIVFDMDETLIHTNENVTPNFQIKVPFRSFQGRIGYGFVQVRPHCKQILKRLSQHFDIIIFTASTQAYADPIINHIDPQKIVKHRLYRQSCSMIKNQVYVKDLRVLGRKLSNVVLVDNAPYSYMMQLQNGIPIMPYYRGKDDDQLLSLEEYLMSLKDVPDVRPINRDYFKLHEYCKYDTHEKLISKLYGEWI